jgi:hypothetical protein
MPIFFPISPFDILYFLLQGILELASGAWAPLPHSKFIL